jgi:hypothetical protein
MLRTTAPTRRTSAARAHLPRKFLGPIIAVVGAGAAAANGLAVLPPQHDPAQYSQDAVEEPAASDTATFGELIDVLNIVGLGGNPATLDPKAWLAEWMASDPDGFAAFIDILNIVVLGGNPIATARTTVSE